MPLVNYSLSAVRSIQKWQASLIDSTATEWCWWMLGRN